MQLAMIDWWLIAGFAIVTLAIGFWYSRRATQSTDEYFVSGRALPWWIAGTSMVATSFAADTPLAVTGLVCKYGVAGNWFWWAFAFGGMFTAFVYARLWRRAGVVTDVELLRLRYGGATSQWLRVARAVYITLIVIPIIAGWVIKAMLLVLQQTLFYAADGTAVTWMGMDGAWLCVIAMLVTVAIYSSMSGMWGVAVTDAMQFVIAMGGCIVFSVVAIHAAGGIDQVQQSITAQFGSAEAFAFFPSFSVEQPWLPFHIFLFMLTMQWWATWYPGAEPGGGGYVVQRMAACIDERHSILATLWYQLAHYCLRPWPWILVAFAALALHPELRTQWLADANFDPGIGYPLLMRELCPPGLAGIMIIAFFSAFMSTVSTQMNWGASYLIRDLIVPLFPRYASDERKLLWISQLLSILVLVLGTGMSWIMVEWKVSVDDAWKLLAALGAGSGLVFMLRWFWWRINAWSEIVAMFGSLGWFLVLQSQAVQTGIFGRELVSEEQTMVVAILTIATWLLATWITAPESDETLTGFYRLTRPSRRGWSRIAALAGDVQPDTDLGLRILAAVVGSLEIFVVLQAIGYWIFGMWGWAIALTGIAFVLGWVLTWFVRTITHAGGIPSR